MSDSISRQSKTESDRPSPSSCESCRRPREAAALLSFPTSLSCALTTLEPAPSACHAGLPHSPCPPPRTLLWPLATGLGRAVQAPERRPALCSLASGLALSQADTEKFRKSQPKPRFCLHTRRSLSPGENGRGIPAAVLARGQGAHGIWDDQHTRMGFEIASTRVPGGRPQRGTIVPLCLPGRPQRGTFVPLWQSTHRHDPERHSRVCFVHVSEASAGGLRAVSGGRQTHFKRASHGMPCANVPAGMGR